MARRTELRPAHQTESEWALHHGLRPHTLRLLQLRLEIPHVPRISEVEAAVEHEGDAPGDANRGLGRTVEEGMAQTEVK